MIRVISQLQKYLLYIVLFFTPLVFLPITQEFFITNKFYFLSFGLLLILLLGIIRFGIKKEIIYIRTAFDKLLFTFFIAFCLSVLITSINKAQAIITLPAGLGYIGVLVVLYITTVYLMRKDFNTLLTILFGSAGVVSIIRIIYILNPFSSISLPSYLQVLKNPYFTPLGSQLELAVYLGFFMVLSLIYLAQIFFSKTDDDKDKGFKKILYTGLSLLITIACIFTVVTIVKPSLLSSSNSTSTKGVNLQMAPFSTSWYAVIETLKSPKTALFGVGPDNFLALFTRVKPAQYNLSSTWQINFMLSRSALLHIWTEVGIIGLSVFLFIIFVAIRELGWLYSKKDRLAKILITASIYILLILLLLPPMFFSYFLLFLTLSFIALSSLKYEDKTKYLSKINTSNFIPAHILLIVLGIIFVGGASYLLTQQYLGEYYYKQSINGIRNNDAKEVYDNLITAIKYSPSREVFHRNLAQINLLVANSIASKKDLTDTEKQQIALLVQQSIQEAKIATQLNPEKTTNWESLASIYRAIIKVAKGSDTWTIAAYQQAILRDSRNPALRLNLGGVHYSLENYPEAVLLFSQAVNLKPDWANAYYNLAWANYQNKDYVKAVLAMRQVLRLIDKESDDYNKAQEELKTFEELLPKEEELEKQSPPPQSAEPQQPLTLPSPPAIEVSPPIKLPKEAAPEITIAPAQSTGSGEINP